MKDVMYLGPCPADEDCAQVGEVGYADKAQKQCEAYIELIRARIGKEPTGAKLRVRWQTHDLGSYAEVTCDFDDTIDATAEYAYRCENDGPTAWNEGDEE